MCTARAQRCRSSCFLRGGLRSGRAGLTKVFTVFFVLQAKPRTSATSVMSDFVSSFLKNTQFSSCRCFLCDNFHTVFVGFHNFRCFASETAWTSATSVTNASQGARPSFCQPQFLHCKGPRVYKDQYYHVEKWLWYGQGPFDRLFCTEPRGVVSPS